MRNSRIKMLLATLFTPLANKFSLVKAELADPRSKEFVKLNPGKGQIRAAKPKRSNVASQKRAAAKKRNISKRTSNK